MALALRVTSVRLVASSILRARSTAGPASSRAFAELPATAAAPPAPRKRKTKQSKVIIKSRKPLSSSPKLHSPPTHLAPRPSAAPHSASPIKPSSRRSRHRELGPTNRSAPAQSAFAQTLSRLVAGQPRPPDFSLRDSASPPAPASTCPRVFDPAVEEAVVFPPGTIVDFISGTSYAMGVVADTIIIDGILRLRVLKVSGETMYISPRHVSFAFDSPSLLPPPGSIADVGEDDLSPTVEQAHARQTLVRRLRDVAAATESLRHAWEPLSGEVWQALAFQDEERIIETSEVVQWMRTASASSSAVGRGKGRETDASADEVELHRVHRFLLSEPSKFTLMEESELKDARWRVRSRSELDALHLVQEWVRSDDPCVGDFVEQCQRRIDLRRSGPPPAFSSSSQLLELQPSDLILIAHVQSSLAVSPAQRSPFTSTVPILFKRIARYGSITDDDVISRFLVDVGAKPPWEDLPSTLGPLRLDRWRQLNTENQVTFSSTTASTSSSPSDSLFALSSESLYASDPLATIRHDFGSLPVYVIDDPSASELDDGISISPSSRLNHVWIHAHIADPTSVLPPSHPISSLARDRATTVYLPHAVYPLLPSSLTERFSLARAGSLEDGQGQEVLTFSAEVNTHTGETTATQVRAGLVRNVRITSYEAVDAVLGAKRGRPIYPFGKPPDARRPKSPPAADPSWHADLRLLREVTDTVSAKRLMRGGLNWVRPTASVFIHDLNVPLPSLSISSSSDKATANPSPSSPSLSYCVSSGGESTVSASVVATCMTLAGAVASSFLNSHSLAAPFRSNPSPLASSPSSVLSVLAARDPATGLVPLPLLAAASVVFCPSRVAVDARPHWAMGLGASAGYVRVTSPLRRYSDLLAHWQIKHALLSDAGLLPPGQVTRPPFGREEMEREAKRCEARSRVVQRVSQATQKFWIVKELHRQARLSSPTVSSFSPSSSIPPPPPPLGPYPALVLSRSAPSPADPTLCQIRVLLPSLGLSTLATHPRLLARDSSPVLHAPGDEVPVLLDQWRFGMEPDVQGSVLMREEGEEVAARKGGGREEANSAA